MQKSRSLFLTLGLVCLSFFGLFEFRVNVLLMMFLSLAGHNKLVDVKSTLPLIDSYLDLEIWWNPDNFKGYKVPEIDAKDWSWDEYLKVSQNRRLVTVVRGLMSNTNASREFCSSEWIQKHGNFSLTEVIAKDSYKYDYDYNMVKFSDYLQDIQNGNHRYSNGLDEMLVRYPDIVDAMALERLQVPHGCRSMSFLINGNGTGLQWHNANNINVVMQYHGSKTWQLLDPKYSLFAGPIMTLDPYSTGYLAESPKSIFDKLPTFEVKLEPGDVLLNPVWYWHRIKNDADPKTKLVAMASCRWSEGTKALIAPGLEFHRSLGHPVWVPAQLPLWVRFIPFFRVLQDDLGTALDLYPTWGQPGYNKDCFSSKRRACDDYFESRGLNYVKSNSSGKP